MSSERLKEQDDLFQLVRDTIGSNGKSIRVAFVEVQRMILEHKTKPDGSELSQRLPGIGQVFLEVDLEQALSDYDATAHITKRRFVGASFGDVRKIFNLATVRALSCPKGPLATDPGSGSDEGPVALVTLDADDTIYADGAVLDMNSPMISVITRLMICGLHVGIVTAASYPGEPAKFEARLQGLLSSLAYALDCGAPDTLLTRFHVMGGQCNYLYRVAASWEQAADKGPRVHLVEVPHEEWKDFRGVRWDHSQVQKLLDTAENSLRTTSADLDLDVLVIRKERAVGIVPRSAVSRPLSYEVLEEAALGVQDAIQQAGLTDIPHCAFNGGRDVFVDIGSKALGIRALQGILHIPPSRTVHCGDRFTKTGNDRAARAVANTLWVTSPVETEYLLTLLQQRLCEAGHLAPRGQGAGPLASITRRPPWESEPAFNGVKGIDTARDAAQEGIEAGRMKDRSGIRGPGIGSPKYGQPHLHPLHINAAARHHGAAGSGGRTPGAHGGPVHVHVGDNGTWTPTVSTPLAGPGVRANGLVGSSSASSASDDGSLLHVPGAEGAQALHLPLQSASALHGDSAEHHARQHGEEGSAPREHAYGGGVPLTGKEAEARIAEQLRSQWAASGGTVVAEIRRAGSGTSTASSAGGSAAHPPEGSPKP